MIVRQIEGGLHSFIFEIGRGTKTSGFHYSICRHGGKTTITHHDKKWRVMIEPHEHMITVTAGDDTLEILPTITEKMMLNGELIDAVQPVGDAPIKAPEIVDEIKKAIARWAVAKAFDVSSADGIIPSTH